MELTLTSGRVLGAIAVELLLLATVVALLRARGWDASRLGLRFSAKAAAAGIPIFVLYLLVYWIAATFLLLIWPAARTVWTFRIDPVAPVGLVLLLLAVHALFEEAISAFAISALSRHGAGVAIAASTLLRLAWHLHQGPLAWIGVLSAGAVFGAMFWRWRNVWPLIVAHAIASGVAFAVNPERAL